MLRIHREADTPKSLWDTRTPTSGHERERGGDPIRARNVR